MYYNYCVDSENVLEWDEEKWQKNIAERGIDFADAVEVLSDPNVFIIPDVRKDYGEERFNAYGISKGRRIRLCFTRRGDNVIRVISMFRVHKKEWSKNHGNSQNDF